MCIKKLTIFCTTVVLLHLCYCQVGTPDFANDSTVSVERDASGIMYKVRGIGYPPTAEEYTNIGQRRLLARRAAIVVAQRNLVRFMCGSSKIGDREVVGGVISGAEVTRSGERPDGSYEVELTLLRIRK